MRTELGSEDSGCSACPMESPDRAGGGLRCGMTRWRSIQPLPGENTQANGNRVVLRCVSLCCSAGGAYVPEVRFCRKSLLGLEVPKRMFRSFDDPTRGGPGKRAWKGGW